jgi:hypothetical protein
MSQYDHYVSCIIPLFHIVYLNLYYRSGITYLTQSKKHHSLPAQEYKLTVPHKLLNFLMFKEVWVQ